MKIKALACISSADFVVNIGEETERFGDAEAARFIAAGFAVAVAPKVERAVKASVEKRHK